MPFTKYEKSRDRIGAHDQVILGIFCEGSEFTVNEVIDLFSEHGDAKVKRSIHKLSINGFIIKTDERVINPKTQQMVSKFKLVV